MNKTYLIIKKLGFLFLLILNFGNIQAQSAGFNSTFIILQLNGGSVNYYDLNSATINPDFQSNSLGNFGPNNSLLLKGAEHNVWKCGGCDLTSTRLNYRIYLTASPVGSYSSINIPYFSGGNNGCGGQDQQWKSSSNSINLLSGLTIQGNYTIEVYSDASTGCGNAYASNNGNNYKATFNYFNSTNWNGMEWSNGTPTASIDTIIDGVYTTTTNGVFTAKTLVVNATKSFTINSGHTITVESAITNYGSLTVENNANLLQTNTSATNTGSIIVNKNSASIQLFDYTLWSSPVAGQNLKAFSPNTLDSRFYSYDSSLNLYNAVNPLTTAFAAATGYLIRAPNTWIAATPTTFNGVFTGVPNNGTITLSGLTANRFYAVGNPYPSTISAALFLSGNTTGGTLYFWRKTNGASGSAYATKTSAGATTSGGLTPNDQIGVGQGFIVKTGDYATPSLTFTNAMRTSSSSAVFLRTTEERNRFWLNLTNTNGLFSQMLVGYMPEATSGYDNAIDGRYINDAPTALTSLINGEEYTIQGRALPFNSSDVVPLNFKTDIAGNYTIAIDHVDGFFSTGQPIYLKDNLLNTITNLSAVSYSFASAIGTFNSRFEVVYQSVLGVNTSEFYPNNVIVYTENGEININTGKTLIDQIRIYDLQGRLLVEKKQINATETKTIPFSVNQLLLIEITAVNGVKITKKIIQ